MTEALDQPAGVVELCEARHGLAQVIDAVVELAHRHCSLGVRMSARPPRYGAADEATRIVSAEIDAERAHAVIELFSDVPNMKVLSGSWKMHEEFASFDLLVLDGGGTGKHAETDPERAEPARLVARGGLLVIDDFTPPRRR